VGQKIQGAGLEGTHQPFRLSLTISRPRWPQETGSSTPDPHIATSIVLSTAANLLKCELNHRRAKLFAEKNAK